MKTTDFGDYDYVDLTWVYGIWQKWVDKLPVVTITESAAEGK